MRCRNMLLGGAAMIVLAGFTPAFAQTQPAEQTQSMATPGTENSSQIEPGIKPASAHHPRHRLRAASSESRAERNTTKDLNKQQLAGAQSAGQNTQVGQAQPDTAVSTQSRIADPTQQTAMSASSTDATGHESETNVGPNQNPPASAKQAATNDASATVPSPGASNAATVENTSPTVTASAAAVPVTQVRDAQKTLASAKLQNASGRQIGTVQQVMSDRNGAPAKVQVELIQSKGMGKRSVWINADKLQYQPQDRSVITNLTPDQLNSM